MQRWFSKSFWDHLGPLCLTWRYLRVCTAGPVCSKHLEVNGTGPPLGTSASRFCWNLMLNLQDMPRTFGFTCRLQVAGSDTESRTPMLSLVIVITGAAWCYLHQRVNICKCKQEHGWTLVNRCELVPSFLVSDCMWLPWFFKLQAVRGTVGIGPLQFLPGLQGIFSGVPSHQWKATKGIKKLPLFLLHWMF